MFFPISPTNWPVELEKLLIHSVFQPGRADSNCWYSTNSLCSSSRLLMRLATPCSGRRPPFDGSFFFDPGNPSGYHNINLYQSLSSFSPLTVPLDNPISILVPSFFQHGNSSDAQRPKPFSQGNSRVLPSLVTWLWQLQQRAQYQSKLNCCFSS